MLWQRFNTSERQKEKNIQKSHTENITEETYF